MVFMEDQGKPYRNIYDIISDFELKYWSIKSLEFETLEIGADPKMDMRFVQQLITFTDPVIVNASFLGKDMIDEFNIIRPLAITIKNNSTTSMFVVFLSEDRRKVVIKKVRQDKVDIYFEWKKWVNGQKTNIANFSKVGYIIDWRLEVNNKETDSLENIYKKLKKEIRELMSKKSWMWKYAPFFFLKKNFKPSNEEEVFKIKLIDSIYEQLTRQHSYHQAHDKYIVSKVHPYRAIESIEDSVVRSYEEFKKLNSI